MVFRRMSMNHKTLRSTGLLLLIVIVALMAGCSGQGQASPTAQPGADVPPVKSDSSVIAEGKVVPAQDASLSFTTGGVVGEVLAAEGDLVQAGQPLIRLVGNEQLQSAVSAAELELLTAQQAVKDLRTSVEIQRSQAQLDLAQAEKELDKAKKKMYSKDWQRGSQSQVDVTRANYIIAEDGVKKATENYDRVDERPQDDPIRAELFSQLAAARQKRDTALANLNYLLDKPNELDVNEANANLSVAQANMNEAVRKLNMLKDGPDADQLALAEARVRNAQMALQAATANLNNLELRAPFTGTISSIDISTGELAPAGTAVVHMADFSSWKVETTDLTELNVARVKLGQPAMVHFDALPDVGIIGRVTQINALGENRQGDVVYTVTLTLETSDPGLHWNMTASVTFLEKEPTQ
jgi:HlyD family secretion protein